MEETTHLLMLPLPQDITAMLELSRTWGFSLFRQRHPIL